MKYKRGRVLILTRLLIFLFSFYFSGCVFIIGNTVSGSSNPVPDKGPPAIIPTPSPDIDKELIEKIKEVEEVNRKLMMELAKSKKMQVEYLIKIRAMEIEILMLKAELGPGGGDVYKQLKMDIEKYKKENAKLNELVEHQKAKVKKIMKYVKKLKAKLKQVKFPWVELSINNDNIIKIEKRIDDSGLKKRWVVIYNGVRVSVIPVVDKKELIYSKTEQGVYTVYIEQTINGKNRVISNIISYQIK